MKDNLVNKSGDLVKDLVNDCISRQAAISEIMEDLKDRSLHDDSATPEDFAEGYDEGIRNAAAIVLQMPSAQPNYDEWYTDCKEYDKERHSCPRWNRVIRQTVEDMKAAQPGWTYIEEALPKTIINKHTNDYQEYNCLCDFGDYGFDVRTYKFGNGHFWNGGGNVDKYVTAWQPLPDIPDALKPKPWEGGRG